MILLNCYIPTQHIKLLFLDSDYDGSGCKDNIFFIKQLKNMNYFCFAKLFTADKCFYNKENIFLHEEKKSQS